MSFWKYREGSEESKSLNAVTTGTGKAINFQDYQKVHALIVFSNGVSAGDVVIETAHDPAFGGVWNALGAAVVGASNTAKSLVADFPAGSFVRARVGTNIVGGNVTVYLNAWREGG